MAKQLDNKTKIFFKNSTTINLTTKIVNVVLSGGQNLTQFRFWRLFFYQLFNLNIHQKFALTILEKLYTTAKLSGKSTESGPWNRNKSLWMLFPLRAQSGICTRSGNICYKPEFWLQILRFVVISSRAA